MNDPILYAIAVISLLATPGPTNTLLGTSGAIVGIRASLPLLGGELAGYLISVFAIRQLLTPVLTAWPKFSVVLTCAVAVYIGVVAIRLWVNGAKLVATGQPISVQSVFITTLLNPKGLVFGLSIIPQTHPHIVEYIVAFCAMIVAIGFCWIVIGHCIGITVSERHSRIVPRIAAVALAGFTGLLIASALNYHH